MSKRLWIVMGPVFLLTLGYLWQLNSRIEKLAINVTRVAESIHAASVAAPPSASEVRVIQIHADSPKETNGPQKPPLAVPSTTLPPDLDPVALRRRADENAVHLEAAVYAEAPDPAWDDKAMREIERLGTLFPGSSVRRVACRKTLCFLDVVHDDEAALVLWTSRTPFETSDAEFSKRLTIRFSEQDGKLSTRIFIVRNGSELPAID